jgi:glycyl-tRNA synthetase alpha chain
MDPSQRPKTSSFIDLVTRLTQYWADEGCAVVQPYDVEVGAGTMSPHTFLRVLGTAPWKVAYVQPSRRPGDGRYGENPNRLFQHHQFQVVLKPAPADAQALFLGSLAAIGIDVHDHDIRFVEDDWESPTLGAWGLGWEVWCDGMEVAQFTYFQQCGGLDCRPVPVEMTYGLERIAMFLQDCDDVFDLEWCAGLRYRDVHHRNEVEMSRYSLDEAEVSMLHELFELFDRESLRLSNDRKLALPAFDYALKSSHVFNLLDARGAISVSERARHIERVRHAARCAARVFVEAQADHG